MPRLTSLLLALALTVTVTGCQAIANFKLRKVAKDQKDEPEGLKAIGTVEMVNPEAGFVIVHTMSNVPVAPGTELTAVSGDGQTSKLKVTPERKSIFITADIVSGAPVKGDTVLVGPSPASAAQSQQPGGSGPAAAPAPVQGIPASNLLQSAPPLPTGGIPGTSTPAGTLPATGGPEYLRVVPPGAPR